MPQQHRAADLSVGADLEYRRGGNKYGGGALSLKCHYIAIKNTLLFLVVLFLGVLFDSFCLQNFFTATVQLVPMITIPGSRRIFES